MEMYAGWCPKLRMGSPLTDGQVSSGTARAVAEAVARGADLRLYMTTQDDRARQAKPSIGRWGHISVAATLVTSILCAEKQV